MADTIIQSIKDYLATYSELESGAPVWVDYLRPTPGDYAIIPLPGGRKLEEYLDGSSLREFPFAFQKSVSTANELERLATTGFFEEFAEWLDDQTNSSTYPTLQAGKTPEKIEAVNWGSLFEQGESDTGIYQIQCRLEYFQSA
jgi:hypothetical protein